MEVAFAGTGNEFAAATCPMAESDSAATCHTAESDSAATCHAAAPHSSSKITYSILTARNYYYEVVKQAHVTPKIDDDDVTVRFAEEAQMYAVQLRPNFVHHLAERTAIPADASLHICVHNPMVDPYLTELYQNFQKGVDRENLLMVILPPLVHFNASLEGSPLARTRTAKCTQFVTTLGDFEILLLQLTAGFMPKLVFSLPIDQSTHGKCEVWLSSKRVLGDKNCHWPDHAFA